MKANRKVSTAVIRRLPRYLRILEELEKAGTDRVSSGALSNMLGYTASQIRQDFNHFGGFGQQGYGYNVKDLKREMCEILGLTRKYNMVIVGAGRLGQAISNFIRGYDKNFVVKALFDVKKDLIGTERGGVPIMDADELESYLKENDTDIGVITVTKDQAQSICDAMLAAGVKGIWNFAPVELEGKGGIPIENVYLSDNLNILLFYMSNPEQI